VNVQERDRFHFSTQMGAIMDAAEFDEAKHDGLSININAPCTNEIVSGDHIEVHIHFGDRPECDYETENGDSKASSAERTPEIRDLGRDALKVLMPRAVSIARQIRAIESSA
jgi:hypothetical protein